MILVLTYHRVCDTPAGTEPNFYTISGAQLDRQLGLLHENGYACVKMGELIGASTIPERRYVLTFDDGTSDHREVVFPLLEKHRCQGAFFIPTARLNQPGYLTDDQVREMTAAGHAIGPHSHDHLRLDAMPDKEIWRQIATSQKIIAGLTGANSSLFVPPGGFVNESVRAIAAELGVRVMRTMRWGYNKKLDLMALETIPINRHVTGRKFLKVLSSRNTPLLYAGKEALKRMVPLPAYERLRKFIFKFSKSD
jgi:peptidoglycan/xylan/chitin deacetylase (PgdA/CDA1 family)